MSYLLSISIGPVQDFIAAARRTADLYAGSQILQKLSKAVAKHLTNNHAELIFPADENADGANKILAKVSANPAELAEGAKKAAQEALERLWQETVKELSAEHRSLINLERAREQLGSFLEFYAAWVPFDGSDYSSKRLAAERLLAGRKALRDFAPTRQNDEGIPKSPLDPARAAVIDPRQWAGANVRLPDGSYRPLRIKPTEHLDAISLLKRCYGALNSDKVVDTRTMARRSWRPEAEPDERYGEDDDHIQEPQPYFAILVADGDRMGELIGRRDNPEAHRALSKTLDDFAREAQKIVLEYRGFMVYSGGDDVLAFLPVNRAVKCADALFDTFQGKLRELCLEATLSAGVAVVHYREPLSISLHNAREAEKAAKNKSGSKAEQGNRLAVALHTRGGAPITVVRSWDDLKDPKLDWDSLIQAYQSKKVSRGLAYEFHKLASEWPKDWESQCIEYLNAEAEGFVA